jgi:hypothetical protein
MSDASSFPIRNRRIKARNGAVVDGPMPLSRPRKWTSTTTGHEKILGFTMTKTMTLLLFIALISKCILHIDNIIHKNEIPTETAPRRRFPRYGSSAFAEHCNWTTHQSMVVPLKNCTIMLRPRERTNEGIADWVSKAVAGYISAKLRGCSSFFMDYGLNVDIHQVLVPHQDDNHSNNWTVPLGYNCSKDMGHCSPVGDITRQLKMANQIGNKIAMLPNYRHVFKNMPVLNIYRKNFRHIENSLLGFHLETGMACVMESLLELSPAASQFEPELFTRILPTLRNERNLVMTLYHRTGRTDNVARAEEKGEQEAPEGQDANGRNVGQQTAHCAIKLEQEYLSINDGAFDRVIWLIVSDSPYLKQWMTEAYTSPNIIVPRNYENGSKLPREIITTMSRGVHTRAVRNPSTRDFAEAMIDWYLIGESDVVFTNGRGYTYGSTGALRTNRPLYDASERCAKSSFIREEEAPTWEEAMKRHKGRMTRQ